MDWVQTILPQLDVAAFSFQVSSSPSYTASKTVSIGKPSGITTRLPLRMSSVLWSQSWWSFSIANIFQLYLYWHVSEPPSFLLFLMEIWKPCSSNQRMQYTKKIFNIINICYLGTMTTQLKSWSTLRMSWRKASKSLTNHQLYRSNEKTHISCLLVIFCPLVYKKKIILDFGKNITWELSVVVIIPTQCFVLTCAN